jgi:hypothetical protein
LLGGNARGVIVLSCGNAATKRFCSAMMLIFWNILPVSGYLRTYVAQARLGSPSSLAEK